MSISEIRTRSEQRLEQLEALRRPLTVGESTELRRCLHAIYMRQWKAARIEREMHSAAMDEHAIEPEGRVRKEIDGIATRMELADDPSWPLPAYPDWQDGAREASTALYVAIQRAGVRP
jgi:hypothetical protein